MKLDICAGMQVRHGGQLARVSRVWDGGEGFQPRIDIVYLGGVWQGLMLQVHPEMIERVEAVATLRPDNAQAVAS